MGIFSRLRFKYKVVILNEHTLEDKFHTRISIFSMMAWMGLFCLLSFCLLSAIILITPLKYLLPGYAEMSIREDVVNEALRIDSISTKLDNTDRQMIILKNIIAGNIEVDSITATDTLSIEQLKSLPLGLPDRSSSIRNSTKRTTVTISTTISHRQPPRRWYSSSPFTAP